MKIGDLVVRTYGEGQRPIALVVGWSGDYLAKVIWLGTNTRVVEFGTKYLEPINESR
jgi:hypothetical protein